MSNKKILIVRLSSLGDCIFNIPMANLLKKNGYTVHWLVSEKGYDIVKDNPCVDKTYLAPLKKWKSRRKLFLINFLEYLTILFMLRKEKYDIVIDTQGMFKTLYWVLFCGAKRRIVTNRAKEFAQFGANEKFEPKKNDLPQHEVFTYMEFCKHLGINSDDVKFTLPYSTPEIKSLIKSKLNNIDKSKPIVVIAPATTRFLKHWNKDNWKKVVDAIKDNCNIIFTGTKDDNELISYIGSGNGLNLAGKTNLKELQELLSRADIVMAPDSGTAHLAWATNKPAVIEIFTCTSPQYYGCFGNSDKYFAVNANLDCQPCMRFSCENSDEKLNLCTMKPEPEVIINIVNKLLQDIKNDV